MLSVRSKIGTKGETQSFEDATRENADLRNLRAKIAARRAVVGIVGQGYVGFPLAQEAAARGFKTIGYDINLDTITRCQVESRHKAYKATVYAPALRECDVLIVAVPTPTRDTATERKPDLTLVKDAVSILAAEVIDASHPCLVIIESTYAPGTTRDVVAPILAAHHRLGQSLFLGYSPERIDPGNARFGLSNTPKVTSGIDAVSAELVHLFYSKVVHEAVAASSMEAAEATKILENSFRFVNITFAQEFDEYCETIGIQAREVTRLASTKPFGFMPFYAGPGIGGHCIAEDPYFLHEAMIEAGLAPTVLQGAIANHESRAQVVVGRVMHRLNVQSLEGKRILLLGVSYKPDIADARRSPAQPILRLLEEYGASVDYHDPHVPKFYGHASVALQPSMGHVYDLALVLTAHTGIDLEALSASGWPLLDTTGTIAAPALADAPVMPARISGTTRTNHPMTIAESI